MKVWIGGDDDDDDDKGPSSTLGDQLVEASAPLELRLQLEADEELVTATLKLLGRSSAESSAEFSAPVLSSDAAEGSFDAVTWVTSDWGSSRTVTRFSIKVGLGTAATPAPPPKVHIKIARGSSGWFSPPGPHDFAVDGVHGTATIGFPDTVADRLMLELRDEQGAPVTRELLAPTADSVVLPVVFGHTARDPQVSLTGQRPLFEHAGVIPIGEEVEVPELLSLLHDRLEGPLRDRELRLEVGAKAGGLLGVEWAFVVEHHLEAFDPAGEQTELEIDLGWSTWWEHPLPLGEGVAHGLQLTARWSPSSERVELGPVPDPSSGSDTSSTHDGVAGLLRPRYQQAQGFAFTPTQPLTGVDLWVRALEDGLALELTLELVVDDGGRPGATVLASATLSLPSGQTTVGPQPTWLTIDLPEPLTIVDERWWVVARVDAGELLWILGEHRSDVIGTCYRRDEGPWLSREASDPDRWALTRVRRHEPTPAPLPTIELLVNGEARPLIPDTDEPARMRVDIDEQQEDASLALRVTPTVAGHLSLSALDLRWREPPPEDES